MCETSLVYVPSVLKLPHLCPKCAKPPLFISQVCKTSLIYIPSVLKLPHLCPKCGKPNALQSIKQITFILLFHQAMIHNLKLRYNFQSLFYLKWLFPLASRDSNIFNKVWIFMTFYYMDTWDKKHFVWHFTILGTHIYMYMYVLQWSFSERSFQNDLQRQLWSLTGSTYNYEQLAITYWTTLVYIYIWSYMY